MPKSGTAGEKLNGKGEKKVAFTYSKGWFIKELKEMGISKHPIERKKLELYRIHILRNLYHEMKKENE
jgi:hypothetical protein